MFDRIRADIKAIREHDPAARSSAEVFFLYSGFHAILYHQIGRATRLNSSHKVQSRMPSSA